MNDAKNQDRSKKSKGWGAPRLVLALLTILTIALACAAVPGCCLPGRDDRPRDWRDHDDRRHDHHHCRADSTP